MSNGNVVMVNETWEVPENMTDPSIISPAMELQFAYTFLEVLVAVVAVIGNGMVIVVFRKERRLRRRTNYYIVSLAVADLLVGLLGIPFAILASIGLPRNLHACLFTVSLLIVLCTISIFCLVAVSVDRYWAILHPMGYSRNVRTKTAIVIISLCWAAGSVVGFLPLFGWHAGSSDHLSCFFVQVMDYNFLVFLYIATIITPSLVLAGFYTHIYRVVVKQLRQIVTMNPAGSCRGATGGGGTMLRVLGAAQKREVKATQNLAIIVLFFMICWIPLYTINCVKAFCPDCHIGATWTDFCIILSHLNSAVNPLLYAYHLRDFRAALKSLIYKMFGLKETGIPNDNYYKPSIVSNKNKQSIIEKRSSLINSHQTKIYVDSPVWLRQKAAEMSGVSSPTFQETNVSCYSSPNNTHHRKGREDLWMISEVPSVSGGERDQSTREMANDIPEEISQDFPENEDDEVFLPSPAQLYSVTRYDFPGGDGYATELPFRDSQESQIGNIQNEDDFPVARIEKSHDNSFISTNNGSSEKVDAFNEKFVSIFSSTPSQVLFFVGNEGVYDTSGVGVTKNDRTHCASVSLSPTKSLRLSPLRKVGDYLFNQNSNISFKGGGTIGDYKKRKREVISSSSNDIFQYLDLHRNGTLPLRHSGESIHQHS